MNQFEEINNIIAKLKICDSSEIPKYSLLVIDSLSFLELDEVEKVTAELYKYAKTNSNENQLLFCYANIINTFYYLFSENYDSAFQSIIETQKLFNEQDDIMGSAICTGLQGTIYRTIGNYDLALELLMDSNKKLRENKLYQIRLMACLNDMGGIYFDLKQYDEALDIYKELTVIAEEKNTYYWIVYALHGLAKATYMKQVKFNDSSVFSTQGLEKPIERQKTLNQSEEYLLKALEIAEINNHKKGICNSISELGNYYMAITEFPKSIELHKRSLELRLEYNLIGGAITSIISLGEIYNKLLMYDDALEILNRGLDLANQIQVKKKTYQIHFLMSKIYEATGDLEKLIYHYKLFHEIQFHLEAEDNKRKISNAKLIFESEQYRVENILIKKQKEEIEIEKKKSDFLLLNILPEEIATELKENGSAAAKLIDYATIMFADFKGFTKISEKLSPAELVAEIDTCFKAFDEITTSHNIEKIKTIGDCYMCAGGLPVSNDTHANDVVKAALEIQQYMHRHMQKRKIQGKQIFEIRIGIHTGPVVAGIVGLKKFAYDIWGDTVNIASRMESSGEANKVNISSSTYEIVKDKFTCIYRGKIEAKGKGEIDMYFVEENI